MSTLNKVVKALKDVLPGHDTKVVVCLDSQEIAEREGDERNARLITLKWFEDTGYLQSCGDITFTRRALLRVLEPIANDISINQSYVDECTSTMDSILVALKAYYAHR